MSRTAWLFVTFVLVPVNAVFLVLTLTWDQMTLAAGFAVMLAALSVGSRFARRGAQRPRTSAARPT